ncbi:hypothetical protein ACFTWF_34850 [Rhodococcus sp. NPDC056960]|uniref:hypothetical protein n=1 Tax=Rhodococcus sp. NPDC056960 TaxID=3345982 RepID=UPI00362BCE67
MGTPTSPAAPVVKTSELLDCYRQLITVAKEAPPRAGMGPDDFPGVHLQNALSSVSGWLEAATGRDGLTLERDALAEIERRERGPATDAETSETLDYRAYGTFEEIYDRELTRLAAVGVADPDVASTGGNCYALTGALYAPDGRSIYLLATTNGEPALTTDTAITLWTVGLYDTGGDSVALAMGESGVEALGNSSDALGCAVTRARTALHQYAGGAPTGKTALIGDRGLTWIPA